MVRRLSDRGATLLIVLALIAFVAAMLPATLGLAAVGSKATRPVLQDREALYAATSALDVAIQQGRTTDWVGRDDITGVGCPTQSVTIEGTWIAVDCTTSTRRCDLNRTVTYFARVDGTADVLAAATVRYRYGEEPGDDARVEVLAWTNEDPEDLAPPTTVPCDGSAPAPTTTVAPTTTLAPTTTVGPTTTAAPTTTTTTTTTIPAAATLASLGTPTRHNNGNTWSASVLTTVRDDHGEPVVGATVQLRVRYRTPNSGWATDPALLSGATGVAGTVNLQSKNYTSSGQPGNRVVEIEFEVVDVTKAGLTWSGSTWPGGTLVASIQR